MKSVRNGAFVILLITSLFFSPSVQAAFCPDMPYAGCNTWCNPYGGGYIGWNSDCESVCPWPAYESCMFFCEDGMEDCETYCGGSHAGYSCNDLGAYIECACNYSR